MSDHLTLRKEAGHSGTHLGTGVRPDVRGHNKLCQLPIRHWVHHILDHTQDVKPAQTTQALAGPCPGPGTFSFGTTSKATPIMQ